MSRSMILVPRRTLVYRVCHRHLFVGLFFAGRCGRRKLPQAWGRPALRSRGLPQDRRRRWAVVCCDSVIVRGLSGSMMIIYRVFYLSRLVNDLLSGILFVVVCAMIGRSDRDGTDGPVCSVRACWDYMHKMHTEKWCGIAGEEWRRLHVVWCRMLRSTAVQCSAIIVVVPFGDVSTSVSFYYCPAARNCFGGMCSSTSVMKAPSRE